MGTLCWGQLARSVPKCPHVVFIEQSNNLSLEIKFYVVAHLKVLQAPVKNTRPESFTVDPFTESPIPDPFAVGCMLAQPSFDRDGALCVWILSRIGLKDVANLELIFGQCEGWP
jgi:hypothetical protein